MAQVGFVLAVAKGMVQTVLSNIPDCTLINHPEGGLAVLHAERNGKIVDTILWILDKSTTLPWTSAGTNGDWTLLYGIPTCLQFHWRWAAALFRHLKVTALDNPTFLHGPWSCLRIQRDWPAKWASYFPGSRVPHYITGGSSGADHAVDYDPIDQDCIDDVEPETIPGIE